MLRQLEPAEPVVHEADLHALCRLAAENIQELIHDLPLVHDEIFHENKFLRLLKIGKQRLDGFFPGAEIGHILAVIRRIATRRRQIAEKPHVFVVHLRQIPPRILVVHQMQLCQELLFMHLRRQMRRSRHKPDDNVHDQRHRRHQRQQRQPGDLVGIVRTAQHDIADHQHRQRHQHKLKRHSVMLAQLVGDEKIKRAPRYHLQDQQDRCQKK